MKLKLANGSIVEIIDNSDTKKKAPVGKMASDKSKRNEVAIATVADALDPMVAFAEEALDQFSSKMKPKELEISFGAEAGGKGNAFGLASVHAKATIQIKLKWQP